MSATNADDINYNRQVRGDMINTYKFITSKYDANCSAKWYLRPNVVSATETRGNMYKLVLVRCKHCVTKKFTPYYFHDNNVK